MYFEFRSISDLNDLIIKNLSVFPRDLDLIVGIPRSGMLPANLLALYLNKPFTDIDAFIDGKIYASGERGRHIDFDKIKKVLIVDDSIYSGKALIKAKEKLNVITTNFELKFAAIIATTEGSKLVDYHCEIIDYPRLFQWNIFHHPNIIPHSCFDIDGVLCQNPPIDDDGPIYKKYLVEATPLYIPTIEIDMLVTCRLEKYRKITEEWLKKHNVKYKHLVMLNFNTKEERIAWGKHGDYKGKIYKESNNFLFIESSFNEAIEISRISNKPVFCTETFEMINSHPKLKRKCYKFKKKIKDILRPIYKKIFNKK